MSHHTAPPATAPRLLLPPPFQAFVAQGGDILDQAEAMIDHGAGTILWREADGMLALALILEPGSPLISSAKEAELGYLAGLAALCDTLAQHGQPERQVQIAWPDRVLYDHAMLAGARWRAGPIGSDGLPEWVIFGAEILARRAGLEDTGAYPESTSLHEEEFPESPALIESFAAFFKLILDRWAIHGPDSLLRRVLDRVTGHDALQGAKIVDGKLDLPPLSQALHEDHWRDPTRGGPAW